MDSSRTHVVVEAKSYRYDDDGVDSPYSTLPTAQAVPVNVGHDEDEVILSPPSEIEPLVTTAWATPKTHKILRQDEAPRSGFCCGYLPWWVSLCLVPALFMLVILIPSSPLDNGKPSTEPTTPTTRRVPTFSPVVRPIAAVETSLKSPTLMPSRMPPPPTRQPPERPLAMATLDMPRGTSPVLDMVHLVDEDSTVRILREISAVERDVPGCEIQVVVASDIANSSGFSSPKAFATALFNTWRLGSADTNDGVLILFLLDVRRIQVAVGAALDDYMNAAWTTNMLQRRAVPEFKMQNYGFGLFQVVVACADRLRDVRAGIASPYRPSLPSPPSSRSSSPPTDWTPLLFLGAIGMFACCVTSHMAYDSKYPMGRGRLCNHCRASDWRHERWQEIRAATYSSSGLQRRFCICNQCQQRDYAEHTIPMLTESSERSYNNTDYGSSHDSGGGGHASGDGGGGASW